MAENLLPVELDRRHGTSLRNFKSFFAGGNKSSTTNETSSRRALREINSNLGHAEGSKPGVNSGKSGNSQSDVKRMIQTIRDNARRKLGEQPLLPKESNGSGAVHGARLLRSKSSSASAPVISGSDTQTDLKTGNLTRMIVKNSESSTPSSRDIRMTPCQKMVTDSLEIPDIDAGDHDNPQAVTEYVQDIYDYYKRVELKFPIAANYMEAQHTITEKMRSVLMDWLVDVHYKFKLMPETLFLTQNIIDRYMSKRQVTKNTLQLLGVVAMLIASKYEEIWAPEVRDFVYISDKAYTRDQILAMEKVVLNELQFQLTVPTPFPFLQRYLKAAKADKELEYMSFYLLELSLIDYDFLSFAPSHLAAGAVCAAQKCLFKGDWNDALIGHSGYEESDLHACVHKMSKAQQKSPTGFPHDSTTAVYRKYGHSKYHTVSKREPLQYPSPERPCL